MWPFKRKPKASPPVVMTRSASTTNVDVRASELLAEGYEEQAPIMIEGRETRVFIRDPAKINIKNRK